MKELTSSDEGNSHHAQNSLHIHDEDSERWLNQNTTAGKKYIWQRKCTSVNLPLRAAAEVQISSLQSMLVGEQRGRGVKTGGRGGEKSYVAKLSF